MRSLQNKVAVRYNRFKVYCLVMASMILAGEAGSMSVKGLVGGVIGLVIFGALIPVLFPLITASDTDIQALTGTDDGTVMLQTLWPILLIVCGVGIAVGVIYYALKRFRVMG